MGNYMAEGKQSKPKFPKVMHTRVWIDGGDLSERMDIITREMRKEGATGEEIAQFSKEVGFAEQRGGRKAAGNKIGEWIWIYL
jgi:hypothetical protein